MEQKKNIAVTLQEAKKWYEGDNPTLKELALKAFTQKELENQELPKTWEEFCARNPIKIGECFINPQSNIKSLYDNDYRSNNLDRNVCTSKQEAEAFLALMQLRQLRKCYVGDWEPNNNQQYYGIVPNINGLDIIPYNLTNRSTSFPTRELAKQFLTNFKDLLEIAKPLL